MKRRRWTALIAVTGLAVLVTGTVDVATSGGHTTRHYPKAWDSRVLPIVQFVESKRGLTFKHPVTVSFLDDKQFEKQIAVPAPESKKDKESLERELGTLRALGLVQGAVDLHAAFDTLGKASIIGLYVPEKKAVFVRGTSLGAYTRVTLAHELTHALQDQYFDLQKLQDSAPGGDSTAVTALIEGDAVRIQNLYQKDLSQPDQRAFDAEQRRGFDRSQDTNGVPPVLSDFLSFPYVFGPVLLDSLTAEDGNAAVDRALRSPPSAEAQIVDPVGHPVSARPVSVPAPSLPAGATKLDDVAPFGQVSLFEVLGSQLGYSSAWTAVAGWEGDSSMPYKAHGVTCVAIDVAMSDAAATSLLASTFRQWVRHVPGAVVDISKGEVTIRSCDPGPHGRPLPTMAVSAFAVLAARAEIIHEVMSGGNGYPFGRCVADAVISKLGPAGYGDLSGSDLRPGHLAALQRSFIAAATHCRATGNA